MKERPIIFSAAMVRAILDERKTMTRRLAWRSSANADPTMGDINKPTIWQRAEPGDRLWVREAHYVWSAGYKDGSGRNISYRATEPEAPTTWTPSIHMPRWASRITLEVTVVRVERLQDISRTDCIAEGPYVADQPSQIDGGTMVWPDPNKPWLMSTPRAWYRELWGALHGSDSWDANPEVAVINFKRVPQP